MWYAHTRASSITWHQAGWAVHFFMTYTLSYTSPLLLPCHWLCHFNTQSGTHHFVWSTHAIITICHTAMLCDSWAFIWCFQSAVREPNFHHRCHGPFDFRSHVNFVLHSKMSMKKPLVTTKVMSHDTVQSSTCGWKLLLFERLFSKIHAIWNMIVVIFFAHTLAFCWPSRGVGEENPISTTDVTDLSISGHTSTLSYTARCQWRNH